MTRPSFAETKAAAAHLAEVGPVVVFASGSGRGDSVQLITVEVGDGTALVGVAVPPVGASEELLVLYSIRGTATMTGRCGACGATVAYRAEGKIPGTRGATMPHEVDCPIGDDRFAAAIRAHWAVGPYEPCPCGSGEKLKFCHRRSGRARSR
jgi:hypothetical protein